MTNGLFKASFNRDCTLCIGGAASASGLYLACLKSLAGWEATALLSRESGTYGLFRPIFQSDSNDGRQERKAAVAWPGCRPWDLGDLECMPKETTNSLTVLLPSWLAQGRRDAFWEISAKDF